MGIEPTYRLFIGTLVLKANNVIKLIYPQTLDGVHGTALVDGLWVFDGSCKK